MFYLVFESEKSRGDLIDTLKRKNIQSVFHYSSLHLSPFYKLINKKNKVLKNSDLYSNSLLRLPLYPDLSISEVKSISKIINKFVEKK